MNAKKWKFGVSTSSWDLRKGAILGREMFESYQKGGVDCLEISVGQASECDAIDYKQTRRLAEEYGVELWSYHMPWFPYDVSISDKDKRLKNVAAICDYISKGADIGIKTIVIHPSSLTRPHEMDEWMNCAKDSLARLADFAEKRGAVIAVENLPRDHISNCIENMEQLLSADERLRVCFDTNHLLIQDNADFVKALGKKIFTLHVSDYNFLDEQHWLPYEGLNDWKKIISALEQVGYSGPFLYEIRCVAPPTIKRRDLTYSDIKNNYISLMNGKTPEILGRVDDDCQKQEYFKTKQF